MTMQNYLSKCGLKNAYKKIGLVIFPESRCNMKCRYCGCGYAHVAPRVSDNDIYKIIDEAVELKIKDAAFSGGGEPALNKKRIIKLSKYARKKGIKNLGLVSNGMYAKDYKTAVAVQKYFTSVAITIDDERVRQFNKITDNAANAAKAAFDNRQSIMFKEIRADPEARLNIKNSDLKQSDVLYKVIKSLEKVIGQQFEVKQTGEHFTRGTQCWVVPLYLTSQKRRIEVNVRKTEDPFENLECANIKPGNEVKVTGITYTGNLYPCCTFSIFRNAPLMTKEEINKTRILGKNALEQAILIAYSSAFIRRYVQGCKGCRIV